MKWQEYKQLVHNTREVIVFPFFLDSLKGASGNGLDIGCASADLTCYLAKALQLQIVGVDRDIPKVVHDSCSTQSVHLVEADLERNGILEAGVDFDFAFSNCCLCHLTDEVLVDTLLDLHNSLKANGSFVFLVPSVEWAREMYRDIAHVASGITAQARFGGRQHFRTPAWYVSALERAGFQDVTFRQVAIPADERLERRYLDKVGAPLFSAFFAKAREGFRDSDEARKAFDVAHENRKLEIQLFWQRSLFFWGFVAAALIGYTSAMKEKSHLTIVFALFGFVCSVVWSQGNRGSKYWQEYWEKKVNFYQHFSTGNIFYDRKPTAPGFWQTFEGRRVSVSKLTMALSDFTVLLWLLLCIRELIDSSAIEEYRSPINVILVLGTLLYCLFFLGKSKSED